MRPLHPAGGQALRFIAPCSVCSDFFSSVYACKALLAICSYLFRCAPEGACTRDT